MRSSDPELLRLIGLVSDEQHKIGILGLYFLYLEHDILAFDVSLSQIHIFGLKLKFNDLIFRNSHNLVVTVRVDGIGLLELFELLCLLDVDWSHFYIWTWSVWQDVLTWSNEGLGFLLNSAVTFALLLQIHQDFAVLG